MKVMLLRYLYYIFPAYSFHGKFKIQMNTVTASPSVLIYTLVRNKLRNITEYSILG